MKKKRLTKRGPIGGKNPDKIPSLMEDCLIGRFIFMWLFPDKKKKRNKLVMFSLICLYGGVFQQF